MGTLNTRGRGIFYQHQGYSVTREQRVTQNGAELTNFVMEKRKE